MNYNIMFTTKQKPFIEVFYVIYMSWISTHLVSPSYLLSHFLKCQNTIHLALLRSSEYKQYVNVMGAIHEDFYHLHNM